MFDLKRVTKTEKAVNILFFTAFLIEYQYFSTIFFSSYFFLLGTVSFIEWIRKIFKNFGSINFQVK